MLFLTILTVARDYEIVNAQSNSFSHSLTVGSFAGDVDDQSLY